MSMMGVAMVMVVGEHVLMRDASLVSELVAVAIELRPIGGKHCTWSGNELFETGNSIAAP